MSSNTSLISPNMVSFSVEYLSTPSRYNREGEGTDPDTDSSSPGNNTSGGSPNLLHALSGEDAVESPPLKARTPAVSRRPPVSSPSDPEEDTAVPNPLSTPTSSTSDDKPGQSYIALISMAILQHPQKKMLLGDIYQFIMDKFPHYRNTTDKAWRNSIRHNLSINECFIKSGRADNGKGNYWAIHPACEEDFAKGDFRRRQARRRARRSQQVNVSKMPLTYRYSLGYVPMKSTPASGVAGGASGVGVPARSAPRGGYGGARAHPYATVPAPHHQQLHGSGMYGMGGHLDAVNTTYNHHQHHQQLTQQAGGGLSDYTNSQYYGALTNACLSLNYAPSSTASSYTSSPSSRLSPIHSYPGSATASGQGMHNTSVSPTMLSGSYLHTAPSPVSSDSSSNLLDIGSSYHRRGSLQQQQQHASSTPSSTSTTFSTPSSSCVYQNQGVSPTGYGASPPCTTTTSPATLSPPGGLYGSSFSSGLPMCFSDMPALRDAINGLAGISS